jgi:hypothetical protein
MAPAFLPVGNGQSPTPIWGRLSPTLVAKAPAERAGFTDTWALKPRPQGTGSALVGAAQQHPRDNMHQLPDHSPRAVGATGQAIGGEEEGLQVVRKFPPVSYRTPGITTTVDQLTILQAGKRKQKTGTSQIGRKTPQKCLLGQGAKVFQASPIRVNADHSTCVCHDTHSPVPCHQEANPTEPKKKVQKPKSSMLA